MLHGFLPVFILPSLNVLAATLRCARRTPACPLVNATRHGALPPDKTANLCWRQTLIRGISYSPQGVPSAVTACSVTPFNVHAEVPAVRVILPRCDSRFLTIRQLSQSIWEITAPLRGRVSAVTGMRSDFQKLFSPSFHVSQKFRLSLPFNLPRVRSSSTQPTERER